MTSNANVTDKDSSQQLLNVDLSSKEKKRIRDKRYRDNNKEKLRIKNKIYADAHKRERKAYHKANKEKYRKSRDKNREKYNAYVAKWRRERYAKDTKFKIIVKLRDMMNRAIKTKHTEDMLGCTYEEFKTYLESKFTEGMTWDNFNMNGWHIDHIKPLSWFDVTDPEQAKIANHYTNLQPLWATENWSKNNRYEG